MSIGQNLIGIAEALGGLCGIGGLGWTMRRAAKDDAAKATQDRADYGQQQFDLGRSSRDDEVRQLKSERDDARHERDEKSKASDMWQQRYLDCRDGRST